MTLVEADKVPARGWHRPGAGRPALPEGERKVRSVLYLANEGEVLGLQNVKKLIEDIPNKIVSKMNIYPDVRQLSMEGKGIIEIEVYPSQEGVTLDGVLYKRVGATNQVLKGTALKEFYERNSGVSYLAKCSVMKSFCERFISLRIWAMLECDAVVHLRNGSYGLIEIKIGGETLIEEGATSLKKLKDKIDTTKMKSPSFLMILTAVGTYAYKRNDDVLVVPLSCLTKKLFKFY